MEIKSLIKSSSGGQYKVIYKDSSDALENIGNIVLEGGHGFCFYKNKLVVVYSERKGYWSLPGGGIEKGETYEEALVREIREETNMKVLYSELLGYQDIHKQNEIVRQTRSFCIVEPFGDFINDPDGDITKIEFINPEEFQKYIEWGDIGDYLILKATEKRTQYQG